MPLFWKKICKYQIFFVLLHRLSANKVSCFRIPRASGEYSAEALFIRVPRRVRMLML